MVLANLFKGIFMLLVSVLYAVATLAVAKLIDSLYESFQTTTKGLHITSWISDEHRSTQALGLAFPLTEYPSNNRSIPNRGSQNGSIKQAATKNDPEGELAWRIHETRAYKMPIL